MSLELYSTTYSRSNFFNAPFMPCMEKISVSKSVRTAVCSIEIIPRSKPNHNPHDRNCPRHSQTTNTHIYIYNTIKLYKLYKHSSRSQPKSSRIPPKFTARWHGLGCRVVVERLPVALATATTVLRAGTGQRHWAGGAGGKSPGCRGHDAETLGSSRSLEVPSGKLT